MEMDLTTAKELQKMEQQLQTVQEACSETQEEVKLLRKEFNTMSVGFKELQFAMLGNEKLHQEGFIAEFIRVKQKLFELEMFKERIKWTWAIISAVSAGIGGMAALAIKVFINK